MKLSRKAIGKREAKILILELLTNEEFEEQAVRLYVDLVVMAILPGARERSATEYSEFFKQTGFQYVRTIRTSSPWSYVEAISV